LPGQQVIVHGKQPLPGLIVRPPNFLLPPEQADKTVPLSYLLVDTGLEEPELMDLVKPGDLVSLAQEPVFLNDDLLVGHSLDNRASVAALTLCLEELRSREHSWDVWASASVQEEVTYAGGYTSTFEIRPQLAIAVDVTFADGPGANDYRSFPLGGGLTLGWGANIHPWLYKALQDVSKEMDIPVHREIMPASSFTEGMAMQSTAEGIPTVVVSIPLRYMHTPVELVSLTDIRRAGRLLAQFAAQLDAGVMERIRWEDQ